MKLIWERDDVVSSDDEFADMSSAVAAYAQDHWPDKQGIAMSKVAALRSKESGELGRQLDELYTVVEHGSSKEINLSLTKVIEQKREAKSRSHTSGRNSPKR